MSIPCNALVELQLACPVCQLDTGTLISVSGVGGRSDCVSTRHRLRSVSTFGYGFPNRSYITLICGLRWGLRAYRVFLEVPPFVCLADLGDVRFLARSGVESLFGIQPRELIFGGLCSRFGMWSRCSELLVGATSSRDRSSNSDTPAPPCGPITVLVLILL